MKIIALDYDDTFTADKELFSTFVKLAKQSGHLVVMVTFRNEKTHPIHDAPEGVEVFYTAGRLKAEYMAEQCLSPNIWIDDMPEIIGSNRLIIK